MQLSQQVEVKNLRDYCVALHAQGAILLAMWGSDERSEQHAFILHLIFLLPHAQEQTAIEQYTQIKLATDAPAFSDISDLFPVANRLQRALYDLLGFVAVGAKDTRPWLRHQAWSSDQFPLRTDFSVCPPTQDLYPFVTVQGEGVHEVSVGPVHAGIIEPGYFRFSVMGEEMLRLEERLGYTHKGIAKRLQNTAIHDAAKIVARVSGDATVAYSLAFAEAIEQALDFKVSEATQWLRAILLERERIANHLGDLGALGNDGGLAFGLAQFSRLKELWLRTHQALFGHRYLMDLIVTGGIEIELDVAKQQILLAEIKLLRQEVLSLENIYQQHSGLQGRFVTTGIVKHKRAETLGLLGLAARASGIAVDCRQLLKQLPYQEVDFKLVKQTAGDVAARVKVRFQEIYASLDLLEKFLTNPLSLAATKNEVQRCSVKPASCSWSYAIIESWRGPIAVAVKLNAAGQVSHAHVHDCSWQNWLALSYAIVDNIVADFPLINKSFNLSYSGADV